MNNRKIALYKKSPPNVLKSVVVRPDEVSAAGGAPDFDGCGFLQRNNVNYHFYNFKSISNSLFVLLHLTLFKVPIEHRHQLSR